MRQDGYRGDGTKAERVLGAETFGESTREQEADGMPGSQQQYIRLETLQILRLRQCAQKAKQGTGDDGWRNKVNFRLFYERWSRAAGLDCIARQGMRTPLGLFCRGLSEPCTGIGPVCGCIQLMYSRGTPTSSGFGLVDAVNNRECIAVLLLVTG